MKKFLFYFACLFLVSVYSCGEDDLDEEPEPMEDECEGTNFTYTNSIKAIVDNNCALSGCHVAGGDLPDYTTYAGIFSRASGAASRTQAGSMPPASSGKSLTADQIMMIKCWVAAGAPE